MEILICVNGIFHFIYRYSDSVSYFMLVVGFVCTFSIGWFDSFGGADALSLSSNFFHFVIIQIQEIFW